MPDNLTDADIEAAIANGNATLAILDARKDSYSGNPSALLPAIDEGLRAVVNEQLTVLAELQAARRQLAKVGELAEEWERQAATDKAEAERECVPPDTRRTLGALFSAKSYSAARLREIGASR